MTTRKALAELVPSFEKFRNDPIHQFRIEVRRVRAAQLRDAFSEAQLIDVDRFNRDVWRLESCTLLHGTDITGIIYSNDLTPGHLPELTAALRSGALELHGNYIWGSGSRVYGPSIEDHIKADCIARALDILNEETLEPLTKAEQIDAIPGFGENAATGLVMVAHPRDFLIYNAASQRALEHLGLSTATLASFQEDARALKDQLGAEDFIELDWFLYNLNRDRGGTAPPPTRSYWWVNQGRTFTFESQGGYVWAPRTGFAHHTNVERLSPGDVLLHYATGAVRAIGEVRTKPSPAPRPDELPSEPSGREGNLAGVVYHLLATPIPIEQIPLSWRQNLAAGPFTRDGSVKQGYLFPVPTQFVAQLAERFQDCLPGSISWPASQKKVWLFQADPNVYDLAAKLQHVMVEDEEWAWTVTRFREEMGPGDTVLLWQAGRDAGIYAIGELTSVCFERPGEFSKGARAGRDATEWAVKFRFTHILDEPLRREDLQDHPELRELSVLRIRRGTNFRVLTDEWAALQRFLEPTPPPPAEYTPRAFEDIMEAILGEGLIIDERTLRRYHLALQTRGFVILSGVSGTGKTWLTEAYARAVGAEHLLVPVAPNWTTNEDLLGYYNPLDDSYHDTPFSRFLRRAAEEYRRAEESGTYPRPFHVTLDEMNLARVEYYFARFLSAMAVRARQGTASIELSPAETVNLTPNLFFIGTVNIDETTHGFAEKVYDRSQLIELTVSPQALSDHLGDVPYRDLVLHVSEVLGDVAPFAFRVVDEIKQYVLAAERLGVPWPAALDEQLLQKVLPKCRGTDLRLEEALKSFIEITRERCPLSTEKAERMLEDFRQHGVVSYF